MVLNCIIIDDEPIARKLLQEYIEETDFLKLVGTAENPLKATGLLNDHHVDLMFLDINMPKMNGLQFLRSMDKLPLVILTTAYGQYALDGFELSVVDYLVKPFSLARFLKAAQKAVELATLRNTAAAPVAEDHFFVKCDGKIERIMYDDLLYVEGMANYVICHTTTRKMMVYLTLKGVIEQLPSERFLQVQKSYIVNVDKVTAIEDNMLLIGEARVVVGGSYYERAMERILGGRLFKR